MTDERPNPDAVLAQVQAEEARAGRGKLKLFFGFAAGVGKTYTMMETARRDVSAGRDVLVGVVETHGRSETAALLLGMDILPLKDVDYRGVQLKEFDLDAALQLHPGLIVVDELAHTNAPGSRHAKRWQDVEELLDAGIDVYTTLNVQHLESLNDVVAQITGVVVQETVPDALLERADEVELVDLPPDALLERFRTGRIYMSTQAEHALQNFFRKANLIALRELALRQMAERVNVDMQTARLGGGSRQTWATVERLLVCVGPSPMSPRVIRTAKRMASLMRADWIAAYVERPGVAEMESKARQRLSQNMRLAEQLGAEIVTLSGANAAEELLSYARMRNVTRIVVGKSGHAPWYRRLRRSLVDDLLRNSREIDVHVIHGIEEPLPHAPAPERTRIPWKDFGRTLLLVAGCGVADYLIKFRLGLAEANVVMVLLLGVVYSAAKYGRGPGVVASVASVLLFDFFFVPPYNTFAVSDTQYLLTFAVMFGIAIVTSSLAARIREQAEHSRHRARRTEALYNMSRQLAGQVGRLQITDVAARQLAAIFGGEVAILLPDGDKRLKVTAGAQTEFAAKENELAVAQWVYTHQQQAGIGTNTLPSARAFYIPLVGSQGTIGVLGIAPEDRDQFEMHDQRQLLETFASQIAGALERDQLAAQVQAVLVQAETERLRSSLLSSVSHDLRTPLAVITGASSSLLQSEELAPQIRRELCQTIYDDARRLSRLVDNLLDMTRIESGGVKVNRQWHVIEEVIGSALHRMQAALAGRAVTTHVPSELTLVPMDDVLIEQVLINLLENAVKYAPAGTPIEIGAQQQPGEIIVAVADRGPGLVPGEEERVFEKFYRGPSAAADGRSGAGLGLAICKAIVVAHGGRIWAENRPNGGARLSFSLPVREAPPALAAGTALAAKET